MIFHVLVFISLEGGGAMIRDRAVITSFTVFTEKDKEFLMFQINLPRGVGK